METAGAILLALVLLVCLASLLVGLPGTWGMVLAGGLYAWATGFERIPASTLGIALAAAAAGEVLEYALAVREARRSGASRRGACAALAGAAAGGIAAAPLLAGAGAVLGMLLGAWAGAAAYEWWAGRDVDRAVRSGWGALRGRLWGTMAKGVAGLVILALFLGRLF